MGGKEVFPGKQKTFPCFVVGDLRIIPFLAFGTQTYKLYAQTTNGGLVNVTFVIYWFNLTFVAISKYSLTRLRHHK